ncbi:MAG: hypothetical protein ACM3ZR_10815 [Pseudomonadota bacterium]
MLALVIIGYVLLVAFDYIPLYRQKLWRDFWANTVIGIFSFAIAVLLSLDVKIPSPVKPIQEFITTIFGR